MTGGTSLWGVVVAMAVVGAVVMAGMGYYVRRTIQKLSKEKEKKDIILNNMVNGLIVVDAERRIQLMNHAAYRLCFYESDTTKRMDVSDCPDIRGLVDRLWHGQEPDPIELEHPNGQLVLVSGSITNESDAPRGILIAQDITRLKRLESTRQKFVANVSHELKTPITLIRGMVETLLLSHQKGMAVPTALLERALAHTDRLTNIIDDLLHLSRLETTGGRIDKGPADLNNIFDVVYQQCDPQAKKNQVILVLPEVPNQTLFCNANLMIQALKNLVDNAIKYAPEQSRVTVMYDVTPTQHAFHVTDNGPGIESHHMPKLFQRFYRVDTSRSRQMGGTGLGLAIVKHIAQSHGGEATVKSQPNQGSTFSLYIPRTDED
jgi:two-component system phosphate regulon sensor histidine kinase PhoR